MEKGKISVIIPVYNGAAWLETCAESVLSQTWSRLEVLILDGGSTDGTDQAARRLQEKDSRVRYIRRGRQGVSASRNQGIEETDGEYLTFVDADDRTDARMLELLACGIERTGANLIACDYAVWDGGTACAAHKGSRDNGEKAAGSDGRRSEGGRQGTAPAETGPGSRKASTAPVETGPGSGKANTAPVGAGPESGGAVCGLAGGGLRLFDRGQWLSEYLLRGNTRCWGILYRREAVGGVRFRENLSIGEDMMFLMDLLPRLNRAAHLTYPGYFYRVNQNGAMLRPFTPSYMDEICSWRLAAEAVERDYPENSARVNSILAVSAMLAAGKLSRLPGRERARYESCVKECRETVKAALATPGARAELPGGYRLKTALFVQSPALYMGLYHLWKKG